MRPTSPALLLLPSLLACGDKDDTGADAGPVVPSEGTWAATGFAATSDDCGWEDGGNAEEADTEYDLVLTGEDAFTLGIPGGTTIRWECTLADGDFSCSDDVESQNVSGDGVQFTQGLTGSFASTTSGTYIASFESECLEDDDCDKAAEAMGMPVPCGFVAEASFARVE